MMGFLLKITQNKPDQLSLHHRPIGTVLFNLLWLIGFNILGFIILRGGEPSGVYLNAAGILIPCIISLNMTRRVIITFDRPSNTFSTRHDYLLSKQQKHYKLDCVLHARLEVTNFGRHDGLVPLTFRSLNSFMRPFAQKPRDFSRQAMSGDGAGYRTR